MKQSVVLSILGRQSYLGQEPDEIELVTEGVLENQGGTWLLSYEESDLTGMSGVTTTFIVEPDKVSPEAHRQAELSDGISGGGCPRIPVRSGIWCTDDLGLRQPCYGGHLL